MGLESLVTCQGQVSSLRATLQDEYLDGVVSQAASSNLGQANPRLKNLSISQDIRCGI